MKNDNHMRFAGNVGDEVVVLKDGSSRLDKDTSGIVVKRDQRLVYVRITEGQGPHKDKIIRRFDIHVMDKETYHEQIYT